MSAIPTLPLFALDSVTVRVSGINDAARSDNLRDRLRAASLSAEIIDDDAVDAPGTQDLLGLALSDYGRLLGVLYAEGYYGPDISITADGREVAQIDPFRPPRTIDHIEIAVQSGPRFRFDRATIGPRPDTAGPGPVVAGFERHQIAHSPLIGAAANAGVQEWRAVGHPKAEVAGQSVRARHADRRLDVDITLRPGPLLRFGPLAIAGDTEVSHRRIREIMGYPQGQVYSAEDLNASVDRLRRTGVFRTAVVEEADTPNADGTLDYTLTLIDEKKRRFGFSAEYGTLDGLSLSGFWLHRNLFGGGERFRVDGSISNIGGTAQGLSPGSGGVDYDLGFRSTRPGTFGPDNDLFFYGNYTHSDDPEYTEDQVTFGLGVSRYFSDQLYGEIAGGLRYSDVSDAFGDRQFYHLILPLRVEWDKRDVKGDATSGFYVDARSTPFLGLNGSQSGAQGDFDLRGYLSPRADDRIVLAGRAQIGTVLGSDLDETPPDYLFFSGGGDTVRGHKFQSLGVNAGGGDKSGGRSFLGVSAEARYRATDSLGMVAFYDLGYVGPESYLDDQAHSHAGAGLGIRYATPIGPIRVDLATPVSGNSDAFSRYELYIGVGQAF
ncbi:MAG: autotransporter assembly complex protein TamA [Qingshengfaniella sp.]